MVLTFAAKVLLSPLQRRRGLLLILAFGLALCLWQLGDSGLVDETPPLFAAAGRAMSTTGDWLTPRVNGLPRFDKPPLVYWLMGLIYALPGHEVWDPLGTWAARLPSALASVLMMLALGDTVMCWPQKNDACPRRTAVAVALAFALSPLVMVWSRVAVSDALFCSTLGVSLLLQWRRFAAPSTQPWWLALACFGFSSADQRTSGCRADWHGACSICFAAVESGQPLAAVAPSAWFVNYCPDQPALVCGGIACGGTTFLG